ncbi:MAG TPA: outer membrane beta-barrel protein, partial [Puia sp.]|nr:outer membrane beta-barrel protein [Puia sp.]
MKPLKFLLFFALYCQVSLAQTISANFDTTQVGLVKSIPTITGKSQMNSDEMISIRPGKSIMENEKIDTVLKTDTTLKIDTVSVSEPASAPFAFADFSWLNGTSRKTSPPAFDSKYFTGDVTFDFNYSHSFNNPIDNTVVGSTALARNNELQLSFMGVGGDIHINNVRGRIMMQFGTRSTVVPRNDGSSYKGQYDLQTIYRYISEAYAGYHWDVWHGINLDAGIFMSYIGLFSYNNFENWGYQPSYTSDNTPWFFNGLRLQTFPSDKVKVEFWFVNGWQSYGMFNHSPGLGVSIYY